MPFYFNINCDIHLFCLWNGFGFVVSIDETISRQTSFRNSNTFYTFYTFFHFIQSFVENFQPKICFFFFGLVKSKWHNNRMLELGWENQGQKIDAFHFGKTKTMKSTSNVNKCDKSSREITNNLLFINLLHARLFYSGPCFIVFLVYAIYLISFEKEREKKGKQQNHFLFQCSFNTRFPDNFI